jgi:phosphatidylserine/phosphatidylglycerophosphate/cardiolipin synthase-like enzyme
MTRRARLGAVALCFVAIAVCNVSIARAQATPPPAGTRLCDITYEDCREEVLDLIRHENLAIDLSFWFMTDARYSNEIVRRWNAGVRVRVIMDPRANTSKPVNATVLAQLKDAGIPMLNKPFGDIAHWKGMIFAAQNVVEFSGANYSPYEYVYEIPYVQYQDESIYFSTEPDVVQSLMRRFDDVWINPVYTFYANPIDPRVRSYPPYAIAPEFNFPPDDSYTNRLLDVLNRESQAIDVVMFRITDPRPADALIRAVARGVAVRLYAEPLEYRNVVRQDDSYNIDRMYVAGVKIRMRSHAGQNHQKTVRAVGQRVTIFGTSNWSTASDDNQLEVNYFTDKDWFYDWFARQFEWKWTNTLPDGTPSNQTVDFMPLPPDRPKYSAPADLAADVGPSSVTLTWYAGFWARKYDIYFGTTPNPPLYQANVNLGPSRSASDNKSVTITGLTPGTTYYWKIVSETMADVPAQGTVWSFTTVGTVDPPAGDVNPPTVSISTPATGDSVVGTTTVGAISSDDVGVVGVQFKLDGVNLGAEDLTSPYSISWNSTGAGKGSHTLTATARDAAGNTATSAPVLVTVSNTVPVSGTIVLRASDVISNGIVKGWNVVTDDSAADRMALRNDDAGAAKIVPAQASPANYVELTFNAQAGVAYHLWIRMKAMNDYYGNDSIHVQFSDSVNGAGSAIYRIGSAGPDNSAQVVLQESDGGVVSGWGWADQGWNGLGAAVYFASTGPHTLRIQQREDGAIFDQIVLSPDLYFTTSPGSQNRDTTIVPR